MELLVELGKNFRLEWNVGKRIDGIALNGVDWSMVIISLFTGKTLQWAYCSHFYFTIHFSFSHLLFCSAFFSYAVHHLLPSLKIPLRQIYSTWLQLVEWATEKEREKISWSWCGFQLLNRFFAVPKLCRSISKMSTRRTEPPTNWQSSSLLRCFHILIVREWNGNTYYVHMLHIRSLCGRAYFFFNTQPNCGLLIIY